MVSFPLDPGLLGNCYKIVPWGMKDPKYDSNLFGSGKFYCAPKLWQWQNDLACTGHSVGMSHEGGSGKQREAAASACL